MAKVSIVIEVSEKLAAALPELSPQVEELLRPYGAKVLSITASESNLSTDSEPQQDVNNQVETLEFGLLNTPELKALHGMLGSSSTNEEDLYAEYEAPASTPTPTPVIKPRGVEANSGVTQQPMVVDVRSKVEPLPNYGVHTSITEDKDLKDRLQSLPTFSMTNTQSPTNLAVKVTKKEGLYDGMPTLFLELTMQYPMSVSQIKSYVNRFLSSKMGWNQKYEVTHTPWHKLVNDPTGKVNICPGADNVFIVGLTNLSSTSVINHQEYAYSR